MYKCLDELDSDQDQLNHGEFEGFFFELLHPRALFFFFIQTFLKDSPLIEVQFIEN